MASTPMDVDQPESSPANGTSSLHITRALGGSNTSQLTDVISTFRATKLFRREDVKDGRAQPHILSLDFDDPGELCMTSESDETIQIYNVKEGRHDKLLASKKYGAKLARFTHHSSSIIYASTKQNDAIRYLATHDNSFIRYFEGHEAAVTCLTMHPGSDAFISCSRDNTVRLWNVGTKNWCGQLNLREPYLAAFDPSGNIFAVASASSGSILLYDYRNYDRAPFATFDVADACADVDRHALEGWTKLEFANDGKSLLLGTRGAGHFLLDAFDGSLRAYLHRPEGGTRRAVAGEGSMAANGATAAGDGSGLEGSGECCFTPDGRYVMSGARRDVLIWDTLGTPGHDKRLGPAHVLEEKRQAAVLAFNPRYNFFATADQELLFWLPDPQV